MLLMPISICGQTYTNGVYVENGKTIEVDKKIHVITNNVVHFSNELIVRTETNTELMVNSFFQETYPTTTPTKAKFGSHSFSGTILNGSAVLVFNGAEANSSCVISTSLTDLELSNGTFYLKVSDSHVLLVVLNGSVKAHSGKKEFKVEKGYALVATPNDLGILEDKISLSVEKVRTETLTKLNDASSSVEKVKDGLLWAFVDGKLIGVLIN